MEMSMKMNVKKDDIQIPVALDYIICITYKALINQERKVSRPCQAVCLCWTKHSRDPINRLQTPAAIGSPIQAIRKHPIATSSKLPHHEATASPELHQDSTNIT